MMTTQNRTTSPIGSAGSHSAPALHEEADGSQRVTQPVFSQSPPAWSSRSMPELEASLALRGEPGYRARQLHSALHGRSAWEWDELTALSASLRQSLSEERPLRSLRLIADRVSSADGTNKVAFETADRGLVESVLMRSRGLAPRNTVCVSSQIGCPAACSFCASGLFGLVRNLSSAEILDQVEFFAGRLRMRGERLDNVVFMGMGEPFLNYARVMNAVTAMRDPAGLGLGARRITVSTVGIVPAIRRFTVDAGEVNLAVSLHAPNDELRTRLVPYNGRFPIGDIMAAVEDYVAATHRRVSFEYVLLRGVNDTSDLADHLASLLRPLGSLAHVNLIPWNPFGEVGFNRATKSVASAFQARLAAGHVNATIRYSKGLDIEAACGQLRNRLESGEVVS